MAVRALLVVLSVALPLRVHAACYLIDGSLANDSYQPCNPDAEVSACCALNKTSPDICLSSGLCYAQEPGYKGLIYSNGCTDKTGKADECPSFCPDLGDFGSYNVLQCNPGYEFCCRGTRDGANCCDNSTATFKSDIGTLVLAAKTTQVDGSATASAVMTSAFPTSQTTSAEPNSGKCPKDNSVIVGGAVGGVLGAALLASLGVIAAMWNRKPQQEHTDEHRNLPIYKYSGYEPSSPPVQELDAGSGRSELRD